MRKLLLLVVLFLALPGVAAVSFSLDDSRYSSGDNVQISVTDCAGVSFVNVNNPDGQLVFIDQGISSWQTKYNTLSDSSTGGYTVKVSCGVDQAENTFCVGDQCAAPAAQQTTASSDGGGGVNIPAGVEHGISSCGPTHCKTTWGRIQQHEQARVATRDLDLIAVTFTAKIDIGGAPRLQIMQIQELPLPVKTFTGNTYKQFSITHRQLVGENMVNPAVEFRVEKTWVSQQRASKDQVSLFRYIGEKWNDAGAAFVREDAKYYYYTSSVEGFSYFIIGVTGAAPAVAAPVAKPAVKPAEKPAVKPSAGAPAPPPAPKPAARAPARAPRVPSVPAVAVEEEEKPFYKSPVIIGAIAGVLIIAGLLVWRVLRRSPRSAPAEMAQ